MKVFTYKRQSQYSDRIETFTGVYSKLMNNYPSLIMINPIMDGRVCRGIVHTNAFDIKEIELSTSPLDLATGQKYIQNETI